jgi:hypothetical protein
MTREAQELRVVTLEILSGVTQTSASGVRHLVPPVRSGLSFGISDQEASPQVGVLPIRVPGQTQTMPRLRNTLVQPPSRY